MRFAWLPVLLVTSACPAAMQALQPGMPMPKPPRIIVADVALAGYPNPNVIARALCPNVAPAPVCMILGGPPSRQELQITFALQLDVTNENSIPLPLVEALVAFTAWPGAQGGQNLGALCVSFCDAGTCLPAADACTAGGPEIRTLNDFAAASAGFLISMAAGGARPDELRIKTLPANGTTRVTVSLGLDPMQVVNLLARFGTEAVNAVKRGRVPQFVIPWSVEGSAWVSVEKFGKIAAGFGPMQGSWQIK